MFVALASHMAPGASAIRLLRCAVALGAVMIAGCRPWSAPRTPATEQRVLALMECYECVDGELDSVVALGSVVVPQLRTGLVEGPEPSRVARMDSSLRYYTTPQPSDTVIADQIENYRALYRMRSMRALTAIGGPDAIDALCAGRASPRFTPADRLALDSAIQRVGGSCP